MPRTTEARGLAGSLPSEGYVDEFCSGRSSLWFSQFSQGKIKLFIPADWTYTDITSLEEQITYIPSYKEVS